MKNLFHQHNPGSTDYAALFAVAVAYLAVMAVVMFPGTFIGNADAPSPESSYDLLE